MLTTIPELITSARAELRCLEAALAVAECAERGGVIIDVREAAEVQQKAAPQSVHIPRGVLEMKVLEQIKEAQLPIYLHCASGARAVLAAEQLQRVGYEQVTVITCPIDKICAAQNSRPD